MAWIRVVSPALATGDLEREYDRALKRAGRIANIVSIMSLNPAAMKASMGLYLAFMFSPSPLSRRRR